MSIGMFKDQQATGAGALSAEQEAALVKALTEERQNFKFSTDFYDQSKLGTDLASLFTEEKLAQFQVEREELHKQYLARAKAFSPKNRWVHSRSFWAASAHCRIRG